MSTILWEPGSEQVINSQMTAFQGLVEEKTCTAFPDYQALWEWSIKNPAQFWTSVWEFCGVRASVLWDIALKNPESMRTAKWFQGAKLNYAENLLERGSDDAIAILFRNETGQSREIRRGKLRAEVARIAGWLGNNGVGSGDRVAAWTPNVPETIVMMLASAAVGATFSSCSPDFGIQAVTERFGQIEPTILLVADGYHYGGKYFDALPKITELLELVPSIQHTLMVPYSGHPVDLKNLPKAILWEEVGDFTNPIEYPQFSFDHPLYILFSSGTTGKPKCIVHGVGGTLLQHLKEHRLHTDLKSNERLFYFTTCGWMMWNWLVAGLASDAAIVLYDGSPMEPRAESLFELANDFEINVFGTSASYLAAVEKQGIRPADKFELRRLRMILSTGSPLNDEGFKYVYRDIKSDLCLSSISGGTDIVSCFALGNPNLPVRAGQLQCRGLGMAVDVFDRDGLGVTEEKGELVCTKPFPSMPLGFWQDETGFAYHQAYFDRYPGVWCHGDFAKITAEGGMVIYGRSDAILNPGGIRIGTAEIYAHVMPMEEIVDCVAVGQEWGGDSRIVLFIQLHPQASMDDKIVEKIRKQIRSNASPRHVPQVILAVNDIPKTRSGKTAELAVRDVIHQRNVVNRDALANPEALEEFFPRQELMPPDSGIKSG